MAINLRNSALLALTLLAGSGCSSWPWSNSSYVGSASPPPAGLSAAPTGPNFEGTPQNGPAQSRGGAVSFASAPEPTGFAAVTTSMQRSVSAVGGWFTGSSTPAENNDDPTRLDTPSSAPTAAMYVGWAKTNEQHGKMEVAEEFYRKAVELSPTDGVALISYGRMFQRQGRLDQAIDVYRRAIAAHPDDPVAYNDMALCLARQGKFPQAIESLEKAVRIAPADQLYKGNLAMVLVEAGRPEEAFSHLSTAHTPDVAHFNMGYLLYKKGKLPEATEHFAQAVQINPKLEPAKKMLAKLGGPGGPSQLAGAQPPSMPQPTNPNSPFYQRPGNPAVVANPHAAPPYGGASYQPASYPLPSAAPSYDSPPNAAPAYPQPDGSGFQQPHYGPQIDSPANAAPPPLPEDYDNGQPRALPRVE